MNVQIINNFGVKQRKNTNTSDNRERRILVRKPVSDKFPFLTAKKSVAFEYKFEETEDEAEERLLKQQRETGDIKLVTLSNQTFKGNITKLFDWIQSMNEKKSAVKIEALDVTGNIIHYEDLLYARDKFDVGFTLVCDLPYKALPIALQENDPDAFPRCPWCGDCDDDGSVGNSGSGNNIGNNGDDSSGGGDNIVSNPIIPPKNNLPVAPNRKSKYFQMFGYSLNDKMRLNAKLIDTLNLLEPTEKSKMKIPNIKVVDTVLPHEEIVINGDVFNDILTATTTSSFFSISDQLKLNESDQKLAQEVWGAYRPNSNININPELF